jgi:hypothetical protein
LSLLDGHPDVVSFPEETKYFRAIHGRRWLHSAEALLAHTHVGRISRDRATALARGYDFAGIDAAVFERELRERLAVPRRRRELLPAVLLAYAAAVGVSPARYWAEKTPLHEHHLDTALGLWPELVAIYLLRDPRDVGASFRAKRRRRGRGLPIRTLARRMQASLAAWEAFSGRHPQRCLMVRYEALVQAPEPVMRSVADFLGIAWNPTLLQPTLADRPKSDKSNIGEAQREISASRIGRHANLLSEDEIRALEALMAPEFERYGWHRTQHAGRPPGWVAGLGALLGRLPRRGARPSVPAVSSEPLAGVTGEGSAAAKLQR